MKLSNVVLSVVTNFICGAGFVLLLLLIIIIIIQDFVHLTFRLTPNSKFLILPYGCISYCVIKAFGN
jgi:hypothetical protein